ncbi:MAG: adenine phosphoribosyltransferase [Frankiales bacterium]|nr:adenine phosphoribosyltransferase [Frankiales bacterium]
MSPEDLARLADLIVDVPDWPTPGVVFKDITPLLGSPDALRQVVDALTEPYLEADIDKVVGIEARGFLLAAPVAYHLDAGLVPVRKPDKLPRAVHTRSYDLEYGSNTLAVHADAFSPGDRVLIVDDVLATGGTAAATVALIEQAGATVVGMAALMELSFLPWRAALADLPVTTLITI